MEQIKLVLFDLDDTLVHFDDYWEVSVKETFRKHFFTKELNTDGLFEIFDKVDRSLVEKLDSQQITIDNYRIKRFLYSMQQVGKVADTEMAMDFERLYQTIGKSNMIPNEDVNMLIEELSEYYSIGIITNGSKDWQLDKLEAIGLIKTFPKDFVFISGVIGHEKPSKELYQHVLNTTSLQPGQILVVGDLWTNDVVGPIENGMQSIWLNKMKKPIRQGHCPLAVINQLTDLRTILIPYRIESSVTR
jgi:putative hydrolase of the HAD superfamily